jgi:hypothetical protein
MAKKKLPETEGEKAERIHLLNEQIEEALRSRPAPPLERPSTPRSD